MLSALSAADADYLVVGAHALAAHGYPRATGDLGIWVRPTQADAGRFSQALVNYGAPRSQLTSEDICSPDIVYQIGVAPNRIDILTSIDGVEFHEAWPHRKKTEVDQNSFFVIGRDELLKNKRATGRPKDLADVAWLEEGSSE